MNLKDKNNYYRNWIDAHRKGDEILPQISRLFEESELQLKILSKIPDSLASFKNQIENRFLNEAEYLYHNLTPSEYSNEFDINTLQAIGASGSTSGYSETVSYETIDNNTKLEWKYEIVDMIINFQNLTEKTTFISDNIGKIWDRITAEFKESINKYEKFENDINSQVDFGINMRNVLEHINGRLFQAAKEIAKSEYKKVNKNLKWARMSDFVASGGINSKEHKELVELHGVYSKIWSELTNILKNNRTSSKEEMKSIYAQYIEFLNSLLLNVDLEKIKNAQ